MENSQRLELVGKGGDGETIGTRRVADRNRDLLVLDEAAEFRNLVGRGAGFVDVHGVETDTLDPAESIELLCQQSGCVDRRCVVRCGCPGEELNYCDLNLARLALRPRGFELQTRSA